MKVYAVVLTSDSVDDGAMFDDVQVFSSLRRAERIASKWAANSGGRTEKTNATTWWGQPKQRGGVPVEGDAAVWRWATIYTRKVA